MNQKSAEEEAEWDNNKVESDLDRIFIQEMMPEPVATKHFPDFNLL
jgi:hypothetical protein